jgi:hypothetical protein
VSVEQARRLGVVLGLAVASAQARVAANTLGDGFVGVAIDPAAVVVGDARAQKGVQLAPGGLALA